jgi:transcriptional regulator with XRE-family HTH domain
MASAEERMKKIGQRIANERERLGLTQSELAEKMGLTREMWGRYERGLNPLKESAMERFEELGADSSYINTGLRTEDLKSKFGGTKEKVGVMEALGLLSTALNDSEKEKQTPEEKFLLEAFRTANPEIKEIFLSIARAEKKSKRASG